VDNEAIFTDQVYKAASGSDTPAFEGTAPSRKDYVFTGWTPTVANKVTANVTYVAQWKDDKNNNGTPDDQEGHFTVTYTDGVDGKEIFQDQVHQNILVNMPTPAFEGTAPSRKDYVFTGWTPTVANKVTRDVTYVAQWKRIQR
ncbi:InlB B-repeat-containing protein, partial [Gardnerella swidsinskii]|uniref:InlB B-repeat-containing protein n=1 Tax=Gardnerella swidsinskii TaxID=2792979 RepID=UPI0039F0958C